MATSTYLIQLNWENGVGFEMKTQLNGGAIVTIISSDENNHYAANRKSIESICEVAFARMLKTIGDELEA